jgi:hypothetical protein
MCSCWTRQSYLGLAVSFFQGTRHERSRGNIAPVTDYPPLFEVTFCSACSPGPFWRQLEAPLSLKALQQADIQFLSCCGSLHLRFVRQFRQKQHGNTCTCDLVLSCRDLFEGSHIINLQLGEFLCPVCRRLANAQLPILPASPANALLTSSSSCPSASASEHASTPPEANRAAPGMPGGGSASESVNTPQEERETRTGLQAANRPSPNNDNAIKEDLRSAVMLILDAEARTIPQEPDAFGVTYRKPPEEGGHDTPKLRDALEGFARRMGMLINGDATQDLEAWEALGYTVQATEVAARSVKGAPEKWDEGSNDLGWIEGQASELEASSIEPTGVAQTSEAPTRGAGAKEESGPSTSGASQGPVYRFPAEFASRAVSAYVTERIKALAAAVSEESRSILVPLARVAQAVRSMSLQAELLRARGMQILAAALLRGVSR